MKALTASFMTLLGLCCATAATGQTLFKESELSLSLTGGYVDRAEHKWGIGANATYFFGTHLGVGATAHWEDFGGTVIDNFAAEVYLRYPLESVRLAPYAIASVGYSWETREWFESIGVGAEARFDESWGVFADYQYYLNHRMSDAGMFRTGIRFVF